MKKDLLVFSILMFVLSACSVSVQTYTTDTSQPTEAPAGSTATGACPSETADLKLFTNANDGYCLLYPAEDTPNPPYLIIINPNGMAGDVPGDAWVQVSAEEASGRTAEQTANEQIAAAGEGFNITREEMLIDGKQAIVVDGLPGPDPWRKVFIVANDRLYTLSFLPWAPTTDGFSKLEKLYTTVTNSLHFLPPAASSSTAETQAPASVVDPSWTIYTNTEVGFSIRYPANWQVEDLPDEAGGQMHGIALKGPEGGVELKWGTGFGGACPDGYQQIAVANGTLPACYTQKEDGTEWWSLSGQPLANTGFGGLVYTNDTTPESRAVVLQVISTLSFP